MGSPPGAGYLPPGYLPPGYLPPGYPPPGAGYLPPGYLPPSAGYGPPGYLPPSYPPPGYPPPGYPPPGAGYPPPGAGYPPPGTGPWAYGSYPVQVPSAYGAPPASVAAPANPAAPAYPTQSYYGWPPAYGTPAPNGWPSAQTWGPPQFGYAGWGYPPGQWTPPFQYVPWGYGAPPQAEAPGRLHPKAPRRRISSTSGRAAPRAYAAGWLLSVAGLAILAAVLVGGYGGIVKGVPGVAAAAAVELSLALITAGFVAASLAQGKQRRADGWLDYFGPSPFLVVIAWFGLSLALEIALVAGLAIARVDLPTSVETLLQLVLNLASFWILVQIVAVGPGALSWKDVVRPRHLAPDPSDWSPPTSWNAAPAAAGQATNRVFGDVALGIALAIPVLIATLIFTGVLATILGVKNSDVSEPIPTYFPGWDLWITLLAVAVVAPIGEEIFFRGFATNAWARSLKRNDAIIRAAFLFAFIHLINLLGAVSPDVFIRAGILAVAARIPVAWMLSWIYTRRRSLYASIALHGAYNGCLVLLIWWVST